MALPRANMLEWQKNNGSKILKNKRYVNTWSKLNRESRICSSKQERVKKHSRPKNTRSSFWLRKKRDSASFILRGRDWRKRPKCRHKRKNKNVWSKRIWLANSTMSIKRSSSAKSKRKTLSSKSSNREKMPETNSRLKKSRFSSKPKNWCVKSMKRKK